MKRTITHRGMLAVGLTAVLVLALSAPSKAGTAIQIGQVAPENPGTCTVANTVQPSVEPGSPSYTVPSEGVITEWSHRGHNATPGFGRLQVWRPAGGTNYTLVGRSEISEFEASEVNTYPINLPVRAGDVLGLRVSSEQTGCVFFTGATGDATHFELAADAMQGETRDLAVVEPGHRLNVSATLDPTDASPPPDEGVLPSNDFGFGKLKKNKKKGTAKLTVKNLPGPGELELAKNKKVKGKEKTAEEAGKEKLPIKPKGKAKKRLNRKGKAKVKAKVTYTPDGGEPNTQSKKLKLKKR